MLKKSLRARRLHFEPLEERQLLSLSIPSAYQYNSDANADQVIYLDFGGETAYYSVWNQQITTPVFDMDGNPGSFTTQEWEAIRDITQVVGEYFSSFMVNVTNVYSESTMQKIQNGNGTRVLIGGSGAWAGDSTGIAMIGTFTHSADIPAFVFPEQLLGYPTYHQKIQTIASTAAHEIGHTLGLGHNSDSITGEYARGIEMFPDASGVRKYDRWLPMMGGTYVFSYTSGGVVQYIRELYQWSDGNFPNSTRQEDSLSKMSSILGYRADDHPNTTVLAYNGSEFSATGKIERNTDSDTFSFTLTTESSVTITVAAGVDIAGVRISSLLHSTTVAGVGFSSDTQTAAVDTLTTTHTLTDLAPGTYTVTVAGAPVAVASQSKYGSIGSYSLVIDVTSEQTPEPPPTPTNFHSTDKTSNSVSLVWDAVTNATGYVLQYKQVSDTEWTTAPAPVGTTATITGLSLGTNYHFRIRATNTDGSSDWATISVTTGLTDPNRPSTPTNFRSTEKTTESVTLAWDAVTNASGYAVQYRQLSDTEWTTAPDFAGTSVTITGLSAGTEYSFRVQASNANGASDWATITVTTDAIVVQPPSMPTDFRSTEQTSDSVTLAWNAVTDATGYVLQYKTAADSEWLTAPNPTGTTATISGLSAETDYDFRIRATNTEGASDWVAISVTTGNVSITPPSTPTDFHSTEQTDDSISLVWEAVTNATGYVLQYKKAGDNEWIAVPDFNGTSVTISGLAAETNYEFRVQATNSGGASDWVTITITTGYIVINPPSMPTDFRSTEQTFDSVSLAWNAVTDATGYVLQYKKSSDDEWTTVPDLTGTSATITGLAAATDYNFRIQAINSAGESDWATVNATTLVQPPATPSNFRSTSRTTNSVTLAWNAAADATNYVLQYKESTNAAWSTVTVANGALTATISGLTSNTLYNIRVRASNAGGSSDWATVNAATLVQPPPTPTNFRSVIQTSSIVTLAWDSAAHVTGYVLQYKQADDSEWSTAPNPTGTTATISGLTSNTLYNFRIQATNTDGASDWATINVTTLLQPPSTPGNFHSTSKTTDSVTLAWNSATGATGYVLQYKKVADSEWVTASNPTGITATITGLSANTNYNFRVQATNASGTSDWAMISVATLGLDTITMPPDNAPHDWAIQLSSSESSLLQIVDMLNSSVVMSFALDTIDHLAINTSGTANDTLTIDFTNGEFVLANGIQFNGNAETLNTLYFNGSGGNDSVMLDGMENRFNDLLVYTQYVEHFILEAGEGNDQALVIGMESNNTFNVSDNLLVMAGGGYRMELGNFNIIDAVANGRNDQTYLLAENDSFIVMNETYVERHLLNQTYRVWYSKQVTAINTDDTNNAVLLAGSHGYDVFSLSQGYGVVTNAVGSFFHEFIGFESIIMPFATEQPTTTEMPVAAKMESAFANGHWDDNLFAFLTDEQIRSQHNKDAYPNADDWLAEFVKLALLDLRK